MSQHIPPRESVVEFYHQLDLDLRRLPHMNLKIWKGLQVLLANIVIGTTLVLADVPPKYGVAAIAFITGLFLSDLAVSRMSLTYGRLELEVNDRRKCNDDENED